MGVEAALDQDLSAYCVSPANKLLLPSLNFKHISCSMAASSLDAKYTLGQDILSNTYTLLLPLKMPHPDHTWETKERIVLVSIFCIIKSIESTGMAETMMSMVQTEIAHNLSVFKGWLGNLRSRFGSGECEAAGRRLDKDILGKETQSTSSPTAALW